MTEEKFWLMKSEPDAYSIDTLKNDDVTLWDGIRNYQARNFMRKMNKGDKVFFYHSNCKPPGIVGLMEVIDLILLILLNLIKIQNILIQNRNLIIRDGIV